MADSKKVELILGIKTTGAVDAAAGLDSISKVASALGGELSKLERADVLKQLGATAAQVGADIGSVDQAAERLAAELKAVGATEIEIRKVSAAFDKTTAEIGRVEAAQAKLAAQAEKTQDAQVKQFLQAQAKQIEQVGKFKQAQIAAAKTQEKATEAAIFAQAEFNEKMRLSQTGASTLQKELSKLSRGSEFQKLATEAGLAAKKTGDVGKSVDDLTKKLKAMGATKSEIAGAAQAFSAASAPDAAGGLGGRITRLGQEARALPSQRISLPGGGDIGTDSIANFIRLGGAITGASEKAAETSKVAQALAPHLGQAGAGFVAMGLQIAPFVIAAGLAALAVKSLTDEAQKSADAINAAVDAQRKGNQKILEGKTSEEVRKENEALAQARSLEAETLGKTTAAYQTFEKDAQAAVNSGQNLAGTLTDVVFGTGATVAGLKAVNAGEDALFQQRETSVTNLAKLDAEIADNNALLESGALAANDAAEAEKKLAEERSKTALSAADAAAKELQSQQKALGATAEQNQKRLETIEDERDVVQKQIDVLTASGVASDDVTAKIAALKDQLGLLGKETAFITDTALEASKARDAEKKAVKDAEDAQKKATQAQEQYTKAVQGANTTYKQAVQDSGIRLRNAFIDNAEKTNRDLLSLDTKYQQDEFDLQLKAGRAEHAAYADQVDDLNKLRKDAQKGEQEALRDGDFKALYLSREAAKEAEAEQQDQFKKENALRSATQSEALEDLKRADQRQRDAKLLSYRYADIDAQTAATREQTQARLSQNRALAQASASMNAELAIRGQFWNATVAQATNALKQINALKMTGPNPSQARGPGAFAPGVFRAVAGVIK